MVTALRENVSCHFEKESSMESIYLLTPCGMGPKTSTELFQYV